MVTCTTARSGWLTGRPARSCACRPILGGAVLAPGEQRDLHEVRLEAVDGRQRRPGASGPQEYGRRRWPGTGSPYQLGWCSWYHYFENVREIDIRKNLSAAADWPIEVFQVDDGFQSSVGDWLSHLG